MRITSFLLLFCLPVLFYIPLQASHSGTENFAGSARESLFQAYSLQADSLQLTENKVRDWIQARIAVGELQARMKANADDSENVIQEFYKKRESLLTSRGWSVEEFDAAKDRIHAAITSMDLADELAESKADHEEEIAEIKANEFYSETQKEEIIEGLRSMREQKRELFIEPAKPDWPAVRPHRSAFRQLMGWLAGNRPNPPDL